MNEGKWITLRDGRHILLKPKEFKMNDTNFYMNNKIRGKKQTGEETQDQIKRDIIDIVNNGQVFEFSAGPQMTLCSRYEKGGYTWNNSSQDEPMWRFEEAIVPHLQEQFVVVDNGSTKNPRSSRFKKYGYEVVGEIKRTDKSTSEGIFTDKEWDIESADKWILMRKKGASK